jgi:hypothetical protein
MMTTIDGCDFSVVAEDLLVHAALAAAICVTGKQLEVHRRKRHLDSRSVFATQTSCVNFDLHFGYCLAGGARHLIEWTTSTLHSNIGKLSGRRNANNAGPLVPKCRTLEEMMFEERTDFANNEDKQNRVKEMLVDFSS